MRKTKRPSSQTVQHSHLTFVLGGARSGKSSFALKKGRGISPRAFVATGEPFDREMAERIRKHQRSRGTEWTTFDVPLDVADWFEREGPAYPGIVVDCLTLWLNNFLREAKKSTRALPYVQKMLKAVRACHSHVVIVSNELGLGLVPGDAVSREFRDLAGRINQIVAAEADEVYFLVSGIPLRVK